MSTHNIPLSVHIYRVTTFVTSCFLPWATTHLLPRVNQRGREQQTLLKSVSTNRVYVPVSLIRGKLFPGRYLHPK